jgi:hypothetical protein
MRRGQRAKSDKGRRRILIILSYKTSTRNETTAVAYAFIITDDMVQTYKLVKLQCTCVSTGRTARNSEIITSPCHALPWLRPPICHCFRSCDLSSWLNDAKDPPKGRQPVFCWNEMILSWRLMLPVLTANIIKSSMCVRLADSNKWHSFFDIQLENTLSQSLFLFFCYE